jgi:hypothetical protein
VEALATWCLSIVAALATVARRRGHRPGSARLVFVLEPVGLVVLGYGLLALAFNGHVEDYGSEPARTLASLSRC